MAPLKEKLEQVGSATPTQCWEGAMPSSVWGSPTERELVLAEVFRHFFSGGPVYALEEYTDVDLRTAMELIALAMRPPFLSLLGIVGREDQLIPRSEAPSETEVTAIQSILSGLGGELKCITNVDETGGDHQVNPFSGDWSELLVVMYSPTRIVALYWGEPMD